jgi:predicted nuclease of predicted toxin-antitoxin system
MHAAKDEEILALALKEDRIVISADSDFGTLLALQEAARPSFILFRETNLLRAPDCLDLLLPALTALAPELLSGCVAAFRSSRLRVRKLPFSG